MSIRAWEHPNVRRTQKQDADRIEELEREVERLLEIEKRYEADGAIASELWEYLRRVGADLGNGTDDQPNLHEAVTRYIRRIKE